MSLLDYPVLRRQVILQPFNVNQPFMYDEITHIERVDKNICYLKMYIFWKGIDINITTHDGMYPFCKRYKHTSYTVLKEITNITAVNKNVNQYIYISYLIVLIYRMHYLLQDLTQFFLWSPNIT